VQLLSGSNPTLMVMVNQCYREMKRQTTQLAIYQLGYRVQTIHAWLDSLTASKSCPPDSCHQYSIWGQTQPQKRCLTIRVAYILQRHEPTLRDRPADAVGCVSEIVDFCGEGSVIVSGHSKNTFVRLGYSA